MDSLALLANLARPEYPESKDSQGNRDFLAKISTVRLDVMVRMAEMGSLVSLENKV